MAYRFVLLDHPSRKAVAELPVESAGYSELLDAPGSFKFSLPLDLPASDALTPEMLKPPRAVFMIERDAVPLFAGPILTHDYNLEAGTIDFAGEGWQNLVRRRRLSVTKTYVDVDQSAIVTDLVAWAQSQTGGDLGIDTSTVQATGVLRTRSYAGFERKNVGTLIEQLGAVRDGFNFRLEPRWSAGPNSTLVFALIITYPTSGRPADLVLELGVNVDIPRSTLDGTGIAYRAHAIGRGEGEDLPISTMSDDGLIAANYLLEDDVSVSDVEDLATLKGYALRRLDRGRAPITIPRIVLAEELLGTVFVGDQTIVRADRGLFQIPDDRYRITGLEVDLPASGPVTVGATTAPLEVFDQ